MEYLSDHLRKSNVSRQRQMRARFCRGVRPFSNSSQPSSPRGVLLQAHEDSFVGPLTQLSNKLVDVRRYSGATAKGLDSDYSSKMVGPRIVAYLDKTRPDKVISFADSNYLNA